VRREHDRRDRRGKPSERGEKLQAVQSRDPAIRYHEVNNDARSDDRQGGSAILHGYDFMPELFQNILKARALCVIFNQEYGLHAFLRLTLFIISKSNLHAMAERG
jgi:hypothetical protein